MASPPHESRTLSSYIGFDEKVEYILNTNVRGEERTTSNPPVLEAKPHTTPRHFAERGEDNAPSAQHQTPDVGNASITDPLDEQQKLNIQQE